MSAVMLQRNLIPKRSKDLFNSSCCIVMGAGGARGLSHLGALHAIAENKISVDTIVGASMGALMASLCAIEGDPRTAARRATEFLRSKAGRKIRATVLGAGQFNSAKHQRGWTTKLFHSLKKQAALSRAIHSKSLLPSNVLRDAIESLIPDIDIRDVPVDLQIVTVDLEQGKRVVLTEGSLRRAIRASMSIPGVFPTVRWGDMRLNDIGNYDTVPCDIPKIDKRYNGAIIAVDVGPCPNQSAACNTAMESMVRANIVAETLIRKRALAYADLVIRPEFAGKQWYEFNDLEFLIQSGYSAAHKVIAGVTANAATAHSI